MTPSRSEIPQRFVQIVWVAYFIALFAATHLPIPKALIYVVNVYDLFFHAAAFFVLGMLTILAIHGISPIRKPSFGIVIGLMAFAALDEYLQGFVNRTPDIRDGIADTCGILAAYLLMRWLAGRQPVMTAHSSAEAP